MKDWLLSPEEFTKYKHVEKYTVGDENIQITDVDWDIMGLLKAQDIKTRKAIYEEFKKPCLSEDHWKVCDRTEFQPLKHECPLCWEELKTV